MTGQARTRHTGPDGRVTIAGLSVARELYDFVADEALPAARPAMSSDDFWAGAARVFAAAKPDNRALLAERDRLQSAIDDWYRARPEGWDAAEYQAFLTSIGYLVPEPDAVSVTTADVDEEIADIAGPQLVVPVTNARYALNAANARWGSLYDALYGTDALPGSAKPGGYDADRGRQVITRVRSLLDEFFPLDGGSHAEATRYRVDDGALVVETRAGTTRALADPSAFRGHQGDPAAPVSVLLRRHGLHWDVRVDPGSPVGAQDDAGVSDVVVESALTTIVDFEDSVAVVDAADKAAAYRNWLGLNRGDLEDTFEKGTRTVTRRLADDREYRAPDGSPLVLRGRSLLFVRTVGHLMTSDAVLDAEGDEVGEGVLDTLLTTLCALPGLDPANPRRTTATGSVYIVKPKMHGPAEVALTVRIFAAVEAVLGLPAETLKLGLMDEERRTSANLAACMAEAPSRLVFVNTGFLDRCGDEIHTSMEAGPFVRKAELRKRPWIEAYEARNVDIALAAGFPGHAQIGKGMWAMPDLMADMLEQKVGHPLAGATTAWVPSPTAATLHALHYLRVDVRARQAELAGHRPPLADLLTVPLGDPAGLGEEARQEELDNNVQSILGYVVRWIDAGVGCSKVPDIHDVALMEDRATLRISSQLLANWLRHGLLTPEQVDESLARMAAVVDQQNAGDPDYRPMAPDPGASVAFRAARELIVEGTRQPSGYTEPILHRRRREAKSAQQR